MIRVWLDTKDNLVHAFWRNRTIGLPLPPNQDSIVIGAIDVGAPKNIGWAILEGGRSQTGNDLDEFIKIFGRKANHKPSALGFEAPLFIPLRSELAKITKQRDGEAGRPWSAGAGATVTTIGLAIMTYTFSNLRRLVPNKSATLDWNDWPSGDDLLIFEAFVSRSNHAGPGDHWKDALNAAQGFQHSIPDLAAANAVQADNAFSLVGACLMRTGWIESIHALEQSCVVIRP